MFILIVGNPVDGFTYIGPFTDSDKAQDAAKHIDSDWWITKLEEV